MKVTTTTGRRPQSVRLPIISISFFLALTIPCVPVQAEDLLAIYRLAIENDARFRAVEANYMAVQQRVPQARAGLLPNLSATGALNRNDEEVSTDTTVFSRPAGQARYRSSEYRLSLTQPIFNDANWASLRLAEADVRRAQAEYQTAQQDLILRTAQAYFDVLLAQDTLALALAEKEALARNLEATEGRKSAGLVSVTDVNDARARFQVAVAQEIEARYKLDDNREALREISGQPPGMLSGLDAIVAFSMPDPPDITQWIASATDKNFALRAAREAVEVARQTIERSRAAHLPTLDAVGSVSRVDAGGSIPGPGARSNNTIVGLQLNVPLYQGGLINARTEEAIHRYEAAQQDLEGRRRAVERETRAAFQGATSSAARIDALKHAIQAAESALTAKIEGRKLGLYTTLDLLDSTRDLYRAKRDYAESRHAYLLNFLKLKNSAATLGEDDVMAINRWLR